MAKRRRLVEIQKHFTFGGNAVRELVGLYPDDEASAALTGACTRCGWEEGVVTVQPRQYAGPGAVKWLPAERWCARCRLERRGQFRRVS